jgi:hypothetical protein
MNHQCAKYVFEGWDELSWPGMVKDVISWVLAAHGELPNISVVFSLFLDSVYLCMGGLK